MVSRRLAAVLVLLVDGWALHATASLRTSVDLTDLDGWLRRTPPEEAVSAVAHVLAIALLGLVGVGFLVYWCATAFGLRRLARIAAWAVPRPLRYLVDGALAASVFVSAVPSPATGAAAHEVPVVATTAPALSTPAAGAERTHVVAPGEYLSLIAKKELGDADLWPELCQVNRGIPQPDGRALEDCDLIRPRWNIRLAAGPPSNVPPAVEPPPPPSSPIRMLAPSSPESVLSPSVPAKEMPSTSAQPASSPVPPRTSERAPESTLPKLLLPAGGAGVLALATHIIRRRRCRRSTRSLASAISDSLEATSLNGSATAGPCPVPVDHGEMRACGNRPDEDAAAFYPENCPVVSFEGPGAADASRGAVVEWLRRRSTASRVLIDSETFSLLFGEEALLGFDVVASRGDLLVRAEVERARRMRLLEEEECEDGDAYRSVSHAEVLEDLLVVSQVDPVHLGRWEALAATGPRLAVGLVLVGRCFDDRRHVVLDAGDAWITPMVGRQEASAALSVVLAGRLPTTSGFDSRAAPKEADDGARPFHVRLFGPPVIETSGLQIRKRLLDKSLETLAYLALNRKGMRREQLVEDLCPDVDISRQRPRINEAVSRLRRRLCEAVGRADIDVVVCEGDVYRLQDELFDVDLWRFEDAAQGLAVCGDDDERLEHLHRAVFSYGGPFAAGVLWEWVEPEREALRRRAIGLTYQLVELAEQLGRVDEAIAAVEHAVDIIDPGAEDLYVRGVRLLVSLGRIDAARLMREQLEARLGELNTRPRPENVSLLNSLLEPGHRDNAKLTSRGASTN